MGAETQRPIAVVIVGGTVSAALLSLVVLPVMYRMSISLAEKHRKRFAPETLAATPATSGPSL
jgi:cobalt-zinc-cadmium resistance protein CzcA